MVLSPSGNSVLDGWLALPKHFANIELDAFVIMPNHFHGIIQIISDENAKKPVSPENANGTQSGSLAAILQNFKSTTTRKINQLRSLSGKTVWQRNYHERVVRNQRELDAKRKYIADNPMQWALDDENPNIKPQHAPH